MKKRTLLEGEAEKLHEGLNDIRNDGSCYIWIRYGKRSTFDPSVTLSGSFVQLNVTSTLD